MVENQFQPKVQKVRTENGDEFLNSSLDKYFHDKGILHKKTCAYAPQENGVVERKHKHLLKVTRVLLFQAHLPKVFWAYCVLTTTYLINKMPTLVLNWKSLYEVLHNKLPDYSHLRTFEYLCFVANVGPYKDKFDARGAKCMFLVMQWVTKVTKLWIWQPTKCLYLGMCDFRRVFFLTLTIFLQLPPYPYQLSLNLIITILTLLLLSLIFLLFQCHITFLKYVSFTFLITII